VQHTGKVFSNKQNACPQFLTVQIFQKSAHDLSGGGVLAETWLLKKRKKRKKIKN
jgi:hypothetical protein